MTKKAFVYLWASCPRLQKIKVVNEIVTGENYPHGTGDAAEFSENDVEKLFKSNAMGGLIDFRVAIRLKNILTAKLFIGNVQLFNSFVHQMAIWCLQKTWILIQKVTKKIRETLFILKLHFHFDEFFCNNIENSKKKN